MNCINRPLTFRIWFAIMLGMVMLMVSQNASSQACCSGGVPLGGSLGLGTAENKSLQFLLTYDYNLLNDLFDGSDRLQDNTRSRTTHSALLEVNYGLSSRFSIIGVIPFVRQERSIRSFGGKEDFTSTNGLGDAVFLIKYRILDPVKRHHTEWVVGAGPKISTGINNLTNNDGLILVADMQPGSGSLDGIFYSYFQIRQMFHPNLSMMTVATLRWSGQNTSYNRTQTYRFGNDFQLNLGLSYNFFAYWPIDLFAYTRYRYQKADLIDNFVFPGSGGQYVYAIPGFNIHFRPNMSVRLSGDIPVYRRLQGTQLTTSYKLTAAISYTIPSRETILMNP